MYPRRFWLEMLYTLVMSITIFTIASVTEGFQRNHRFGITTEGVSEFQQEIEHNIMTEKIALKFLDEEMVQEYRDTCPRGAFSLFLGGRVAEPDISNCTMDDEHVLIYLKHDTDLPFGAYAIVKRIRVTHFQSSNEGHCILNGVMPEFYAFLTTFLGWDKLLPLPESTFSRFSLINQGYVYNPEQHSETLNNCIALLMNDDSSHDRIKDKCPFRCQQNVPTHGEL